MPDPLATAAAPAAIANSDAQPYEAAEVVRHVAHELRQPLSTMESIAYYLEITLPHAESRARAQVGKLQQMVHQCNWILSDAIHYLQAAPPRPELLDLSEIVSEALTEWLGEEPAQMEYEPAEHLPPVVLDAGQAQHLLCNLFTFFQQVARGGIVTIRTWSEGERACLEMAAPAPGYDAETLATLFEPFSAHLPGGSGLALASVRRIAEAHGAVLDASFTERGHLRLRITFR
jgi:signal transduction histidine kinase